MVIILGILIGLCFSGSIDIIVSHILKKDKKRKWKEEERIRTLENELSFLNSKCNNTQKACRLLSEEVKRLNKIIEKEIPQTMQEKEMPRATQEKDNSTPRMNNGFSYNEPLSEPLQDIRNAIYNSLQPTCTNENLTLQNLESMINCHNASMTGNLELMTKCGVSFEEAQEKLSYPYMYLWLRSPNENE